MSLILPVLFAFRAAVAHYDCGEGLSVGAREPREVAALVSADQGFGGVTWLGAGLRYQEDVPGFGADDIPVG